MSNPNELKQARAAFESAARILAGVESLPRRRGSTVTWSNGVVWTRVDDNQWSPRSSTANNDYVHPFPYSSAHVASGTIISTEGS